MCCRRTCPKYSFALLVLLCSSSKSPDADVRSTITIYFISWLDILSGGARGGIAPTWVDLIGLAVSFALPLEDPHAAVDVGFVASDLHGLANGSAC
ncbi:hypothetical protein PC116_g18627 [Phytophthora cactorum]|nr:hypothetical protein PC116_g18627 [Phytophthora cactorum]